MGLVRPLTGCLVCLNSTENITVVPEEESQKIFNICCSYVENAINVNYLIRNITENNNKLSFCRKCLDSSLNLAKLLEQLAQLKKEILDSTNNFSESVLKRRFQTLAKENKKHDVDSSSRLIVDHHMNQIEEINTEREIVKSEKQDGLAENEDLFTNLFCDDEPNNFIVVDHLSNVNHITNDPLLQTDELEINYGIVEKEYEAATEPVQKIEISESESQVELENYEEMPNVVHGISGVSGHITSRRSAAFKSYRGYPSGTDCELNEKVPVISKGAGNAEKKRLSKRKKGKIVRSYQCEQCLKNFTTVMALKKHIKIHSIVKRLECPVCQKRFQYSNKLKRHYMTHTGERPFKCSWCDASFIQSSDLKVHERIHTGHKPYQCSFCEITFISAARRLCHERSFHSVPKRKSLVIK